MTNEQKAQALAELDSSSDLYVIVKRGMYYRPDAHGYTYNENEAWKLPPEEAKKHEYLRGYEPVTIKPASRKNYFQYNEIIPLIQKQKWNVICEVAIQRRIALQKEWDNETVNTVPTINNTEGWCAEMLKATPTQLADALLIATGKQL